MQTNKETEPNKVPQVWVMKCGYSRANKMILEGYANNFTVSTTQPVKHSLEIAPLIDSMC